MRSLFRKILERPFQGNSKQRKYNKGIWAERYALLYLRVIGYKILAHRYRSHYGEIDIIAYKNKTLIAIEVKYRSTHHTALESVQPKQMNRIMKSLLLFQSKNTAYHNALVRFDVITISQQSLFPVHLKNIHLENTSGLS